MPFPDVERAALAAYTLLRLSENEQQDWCQLREAWERCTSGNGAPLKAMSELVWRMSGGAPGGLDLARELVIKAGLASGLGPYLETYLETLGE